MLDQQSSIYGSIKFTDKYMWRNNMNLIQAISEGERQSGTKISWEGRRPGLQHRLSFSVCPEGSHLASLDLCFITYEIKGVMIGNL